MRSRKIVTIVFTDVVGSTALGERLDAELLGRVMTRYFERMRGVLEQHGGRVEKYIGDAIVAVFGVPEVHEDDALRAVRAAVEMREALGALNAELEDRWGVRIEARTGANTGEVLVDENRMDAPLTSDSANVAARLEQAATAGEILIGASTHLLVKDAVEAERLPPLEVKGKAQPLTAWRLLGTTTEGRGIARRLDSALVGRDGELSSLRAAFAEAVADSSCRLVTILGEPGLGKTRLAAELASALEGRATILQGRCLPYGEGITFWPIAEALRQIAGITATTPADETRHQIGVLLGEVSDAEAIVERLSSILVASETPPATQEVFWAVRRLLETLAARRPLAAFLDDIHWGEPTFLDLLEYLAGWSTDSPILLVAQARPELLDARPGWGGESSSQRSIRLRPLSGDQSETLVENLLGEASLEEDVRRRIRDAAEGNPLFVEEILRMLVDDDLLRREDGGWVAAGDLSRISIPPTISALLTERLERLTSEERRTIQRASVIGREFWWGAVGALSPEDARPGVGAHLQALVRRELIRPDRSTFPGEDAFRFGHILTRDAAYQGTTKEERAELHSLFADWLQRRAGERVAQYDEIVGYHLETASRYLGELGIDHGRARELAAEASRFLAAAGQRAFERSDIPAAVTLLTRATELLRKEDRAYMELLPDLGLALDEAGELDRARRVLDEAQQLTADLGEERLGAHATIARALVLRMRDDHLSDRERALRAIEVFERGPDHRGLARALNLLSLAAFLEGRGAEAEEAAERAQLHALEATDLREQAESCFRLSVALVHGPRPIEEAEARAEEILDVYPGNRTIEAYMSHALAHLVAWRGAFEEGRRCARRYREIVRDNGQRYMYADATEAIGDVELAAGKVDEAVRILLEGERLLTEMGEETAPDSVSFLAVALYHAGRYDEAADRAERVMSTPHPLWSRLAMGTLAKVRAREGRLEEADRLSEDAAEAVRGFDLLALRGRTLLDRGEVLKLLGRDAEAHDVIEESIALFEQKGSTAHAEQARAVLRGDSPR